MFKNKFFSIFLLILLLIALAFAAYSRFKPVEYSAQTSGVSGIVLLGPQCPVVRESEPCPDKPYQTTLAVTSPDGSQVIKEFRSETDGRFNVQVPPGEYAIRSAAAANVLPYCRSQGTITVKLDNYTSVTITCDTGIR